MLGAGTRQRYPEHSEIFLEERRLPQILDALLQPDSCGVDVGAHLGSFLRLLIDVAPHGKHFAVEASPTRGNHLARRFPNATIFQCAASDCIGTASFHEDTQEPGYSGLTQNGTHSVETRPLDELLRDSDRIDLIKLDIEGHELAALRGAQATINQFQPAIIFECAWCDPHRNEVFQFLTEEAGYNVFSFGDFLFNKGPLSKDEFRKYGIQPPRALNYLAVKAGRCGAAL
jgi:FkbM family methyltransferase